MSKLVNLKYDILSIFVLIIVLTTLYSIYSIQDKQLHIVLSFIFGLVFYLFFEEKLWVSIMLGVALIFGKEFTDPIICMNDIIAGLLGLLIAVLLILYSKYIETKYLYTS